MIEVNVGNCFAGNLKLEFGLFCRTICLGLKCWIFLRLFFILPLSRVRRPCRGLEKLFPPVLQRCLNMLDFEDQVEILLFHQVTSICTQSSKRCRSLCLRKSWPERLSYQESHLPKSKHSPAVYPANAFDSHSQKFLTSSWLCVAQPGRVREPTADRGRWSPQRCAGIQCSGRSWRKKKISSLSGTILS